MEIGPHGDCGVPLALISKSNLTSAHKVQSSQESMRLLSPIPEQNSTSETSTCNASPLAVPAASLSMPSADVTATLVQSESQVLEAVFIPIEPAALVEDASKSHSPDLTYSIHGGERLLPLLSLSHRMTRLLETHDVHSEHEASSTLSSLADSELSSLDTTASSSLTMVCHL